MTWLTGWNYRKAITVSNSGSSLTDYQVLITVDTLALVNAGKMQSDCRDIRFTSSDGSTLLNYWIESGQNTASTKIWIKSTLANGNNTVYMYYGNSGTTSTSNGTNTFEFFDDFSGDLSKWQGITGDGSILNGIMTFTNPSSAWHTMKTKYIATPPIILESYSKIPSSNYVRHGFTDDTSGNDVGLIEFIYHGEKILMAQSYTNHHNSNWTSDIYTKFKIAWKTGEAKFYNDNVEVLGSPITSDLPASTRVGYSAYTNTIYADWIFVRKYASPEPTAALGTEQTPANITATSMTITPSEIPCRVGICTVTVEVIWTNNGGSSGDFIPNITIDGTPYSSPYPLQSLGAGASTTKTFVISGLVVGTRNICPYPN